MYFIIIFTLSYIIWIWRLHHLTKLKSHSHWSTYRRLVNIHLPPSRRLCSRQVVRDQLIVISDENESIYMWCIHEEPCAPLVYLFVHIIVLCVVIIYQKSQHPLYLSFPSLRLPCIESPDFWTSLNFEAYTYTHYMFNGL